MYTSYQFLVSYMRTRFGNFGNDERGATIHQWALFFAIIAVLIMVALTLLYPPTGSKGQ